MNYKISSVLLTFLVLLINPITLTAQETNIPPSTLEVTGGIGFLNLLENNVTHRFDSYTNDITGNMQKTGFSGYSIHFGLLGNKNMGSGFWLQSGLKLHYINGSYKGYSDLRFLNPIQDLVEHISWKNETEFTGFDIPILIEYQRPVKNWSLYSQLGFSFSYSKTSSIQNGFENRYYSYYLDYDESCDCFIATNIQQIDPAFQQTLKSKEVNPLFEFNGLFGLGVILKEADGNEWRIGYRFSGNLLPLRKGNNSYDQVYEPSRINSVNHYQMIHQLEVGMQWQRPDIQNDSEAKIWNRFYAGLGINMQIAPKKNQDAIRSGFGWGRYAQVMYLSKIGLGLRAEVAKWIAPDSRYGTTSMAYKGEAIYHIPCGFMAYGGVSRRRDNNSDGGYGNGYGYHIGSGWLVPLHGAVRVQFLYTNYYYPNFPDERFLMEFGVGALLSF